MTTFDDYFSEHSIIRVLCDLRRTKARSVHERRFFRKIFELGPEVVRKQIYALLPPRRQWTSFRPRRSERKKCGDPTSTALYRCVMWHRRQGNSPDWLRRLEDLIRKIRKEVLQDSTFSFSAPHIVPQHKSDSNYRAISSFSRLEDKVVDILNARYLREQLDDCFEDASVAFRGKRAKPLNRDTAIEAIFKIREHYEGEQLYVTECDIRGFFDCVHHPVAKKALSRAIELLRVRMPEVSIDQRAQGIFRSYLDCYSFSQTVLPKETELRQQTKDNSAVYKWPLSRNQLEPKPNDLRFFHKRPRAARIGIPQGGALSCLIANLVLDFADKEICLQLYGASPPSVYLRYCDDIIIISPSAAACQAATLRYKQCLEQLKLPYHLPVVLTGDPKQFYNDSKTKECYEWGADRNATQFPWIQFLGYQIRYDGQIRVRPTSINKQKNKVDNLRESLTNELKRKSAKVSAKRVIYRFNSKIWAFSSGRVVINSTQNLPLPMCWASGFRQLAKHPFYRNHIRQLDRHVGKNRRRLQRFLRKSRTGTPAANTRQSRKLNAHFGAPFSHLRQFASQSKNNS